jgi:hypothetical protein
MAIMGRKSKTMDSLWRSDWVSAGCSYFQLNEEALGHLPKSDARKSLIASLIHAQTTMPLDWISERLQMGVRAGV